MIKVDENGYPIGPKTPAQARADAHNAIKQLEKLKGPWGNAKAVDKVVGGLKKLRDSYPEPKVEEGAAPTE